MVDGIWGTSHHLQHLVCILSAPEIPIEIGLLTMIRGYINVSFSRQILIIPGIFDDSRDHYRLLVYFKPTTSKHSMKRPRRYHG